MVKQFESACDAESLSYLYSDIQYLTDKERKEQESDLWSNKSITHPALTKNERFKHQQEFRFCVNIPFEEGEIRDSLTINIGSIENISCIIPFSDFMKHPILIDINKKECSLITEVSYEDL